MPSGPGASYRGPSVLAVSMQLHHLRTASGKTALYEAPRPLGIVLSMELFFTGGPSSSPARPQCRRPWLSETSASLSCCAQLRRRTRLLKGAEGLAAKVQLLALRHAGRVALKGVLACGRRSGSGLPCCCGGSRVRAQPSLVRSARL